MAGLASWIGNVFSRGDAGISVPAMDGVLKPNMALDGAEHVFQLPGIDDLAFLEGTVVASAGSALYEVPAKPGRKKARLVASFENEIGFVTALEDGSLAVGILGQGVQIGHPGKFRHIDLAPEISAGMTAAAVLPDGRLAICIGSRGSAAADWKRDLMEHGQSGQVLLLDLKSGEQQLVADRLAYPYGIALHPDGRLIVSESWRHRIIALDIRGGEPPQILLEDLPAYSSRVTPALDGGFWLALFAPRRQLFEFVLREDGFRQDMMANVPPEEWVGPSLAASSRYDHPLQQGSVRQMGVLKPWAPSSSYGLIVKCDASMRPVESWHSRADGRMHGITAVCETGNAVFAAAKGPGILLSLSSHASEPRGKRK